MAGNYVCTQLGLLSWDARESEHGKMPAQSLLGKQLLACPTSAESCRCAYACILSVIYVAGVQYDDVRTPKTQTFVMQLTRRYVWGCRIHRRISSSIGCYNRKYVVQLCKQIRWLKQYTWLISKNILIRPMINTRMSKNHQKCETK